MVRLLPGPAVPTPAPSAPLFPSAVECRLSTRLRFLSARTPAIPSSTSPRVEAGPRRCSALVRPEAPPADPQAHQPSTSWPSSFKMPEGFLRDSMSSADRNHAARGVLLLLLMRRRRGGGQPETPRNPHQRPAEPGASTSQIADPSRTRANSRSRSADHHRVKSRGRSSPWE